MALNRQISRLAKILVESEGVTFAAAEARLRSLTLEIVVGDQAGSPAAHAAVLTALSVARRTFLGGVRVVGQIDQPLNSALPMNGRTLKEAVAQLGCTSFRGAPLRRIIVGQHLPMDGVWSITTSWDGWRASITRAIDPENGPDDQPLAGIAAGGLAVGAAFQSVRGVEAECEAELDLWGDLNPPQFQEVFLPGALWLIGIGNLGQAYLWALASLPYEDPRRVQLVLQDRDRVTEENWGTSVLVREEAYGELKTKIGEHFAAAKGFSVRRIDRRLLAADRLEDEDPRVALSGVDKISVRRLMARSGFGCIVDAGLGRTASNFDQYRVSVFDNAHPIDRHFEGMNDDGKAKIPPVAQDAYDQLQNEIGTCGTAEMAGASAAVPYVSAIAAATAVSRLIRLASGLSCPASEVARVTTISRRRLSPCFEFDSRAVSHAGRPKRGTQS